MKKPYIIIIILLGAAIVLSIANAFMSNMLSTSGIFVSQAERQINAYKTQNAILSEELLTASSLVAISEKAEQSGFVSDSELMVVDTSRSLAVKP